MKKNYEVFVFFAFFTAASLALSGCGQNNPVSGPGEEKINVMVSVLPQVEFVERIGGDKVSVTEMIPPGFSPATYDPSPEQLAKLQKAELYFRIGHIPFEKAQMGKLEQINPEMKVVDTSAGISLLTMAAHSHDHDKDGAEPEEEEEEQGREEEHETGNDPHIWLSPNLVKVQAEHIYDALAGARPADEAYFNANYKRFLSDLDELDANLKDAFAPIIGKTILVFHPAFGYLADAYGFEQEAIEIEGKEPSPKQLKEIIEEARADEAKVIFVQRQFSSKAAEAVAREIGGAVVRIDPLAKNYFANLKNMSQVITNNPR